MLTRYIKIEQRERIVAGLAVVGECAGSPHRCMVIIIRAARDEKECKRKKEREKRKKERKQEERKSHMKFT